MTAWALIAATGVALAGPLVHRIARRRWDPFEPIVLFAAAYAVMFVVRPASMLTREDGMVFFSVDVSAGFQTMLVLALLGAVGFVVGYELRLAGRIARALPRPPDDLDTRRTAVGACVLAVLGVAALAAFLPLSSGTGALRLLLGGRSEALADQLASSSTYAWYGSLLVVPASIALVSLALARRSLGLLLVAAPVLAIALVRTIPLGTRIALLPLVGGIVVFVYLHRGRRPGPVALAAVIVLALLVSYAALFLRYPETRGQTPGALLALVRHPDRLAAPVTRGADAEMAAALSGALLVVPDKLGHRYGGATLGDLVVRPVPRQWWSGKPPPPTEEVVATVWPEAARYGFNPAFSPLLFFYWDFGLPGAVVGLALYGFLARMMYAYFSRHESALSVRVTYAVAIFYVIVAARNGPVDMLVQASFVVVPLALVIGLGSKTYVPQLVGRHHTPGRVRVPGRGGSL